jgi:LuxR family maltose regulon positive regulatory protein
MAALALQALVRASCARQEQALDSLEQALQLAAPEEFVRTFLDLGEPMRALLQQLAPALRAQERGSEQLLAFAATLLAAFRERAGEAAGESTAAGTAVLVEPLTGRELEVLALMADGLTNRQIADRLFIARGTVKAHAASIYGKLGVHNRTHAVTRAQELEIL